MTILEELARDLEAVTDADIERFHARLDPRKDNEAILVQEVSETAKRWFTLINVYTGEMTKANYAAEFIATDDDERLKWKTLACRCHAKCSIASEIAWIVAKDEAAVWRPSGGSAGLRTGFTIVDMTEEEPVSISDAFGSLVEGLRRAAREHAAKKKEEEPEPEPPAVH